MNPPSRFLNEIDRECMEADFEEAIVTKKLSTMKKSVDPNAEYQVGDHIMHSHYVPS